ncbi:alpha/beta fold hydrolase [Bacillus suaedaesalsae]|uniref:Alpha/beta fold hydrolase n=1 Tax=Bacillus suaedaesalsae TaxID=2810349 RepID=A0ABS2DGU3_9BACI|nr:alpha/beta fold hydrolase [Bacillus suaedaesalsae]
MIGCLCIHGFTGSPYEVEPIVEYLKENTNWNIVSPTLPGHGEEATLEKVSYMEWISFVEKSMETLTKECETVYVIGFSMGGLLASYLATKYRVDKLVLLSAAAQYINIKQLALDIRDIIKDGLRGHIQDNVLFQRYRRKIVATPLSATREFRKLVRYIKPQLRHVEIPTLIVQGVCDGIVPVTSAHYLFETICSEEKKLVFLASSHHHVCHGPDYEQLEEEISQFLNIKEKSSC